MSVKKLTGEEIRARVDTLPMSCLKSLAIKLLVNVSGVLCRVLLDEADLANFVLYLEERKLLMKQIEVVRPAVHELKLITYCLDDKQREMIFGFNKLVKRCEKVTKTILEMQKLPHIAKLCEGGDE